MTLLVGADPELFVQKDGVFMSAHALIKGTKKQPFLVDKGAVQVDGTALEFNILPAATEKEWVDNIETVMRQLSDMVRDYDIVIAPVAEYTKEYLQTLPKEALILGCDPDYNAWTESVNTKPDMRTSFRTAAGHIHLGFCDDGDESTDSTYFMMCCDLVKQLDFYLGLPSLLFDDESKRREMYGKAGAFRPKVYGVEYRVLSNKWLMNREVMSWAYRATIKAAEEFFEENILLDTYGDIQEIINTSNIDEAQRIIEDAQLEVYNVR